MSKSLVPTKKRIGLVATYALAAVLAATIVGCSKKETTATPAVNDKVYSVTPDTVQVAVGIVTGELSEMKVTERVEEGSGRIVTPAKLTGTLSLKNTSADQAVRLIAGKVLYIDAQGQPIQLKENRGEATITVGSTYGPPERLDPGQESSKSMDVEFPVEALKAKRLKEIRLELSYIPLPFKEERLDFVVSISAQ